MKKKSLKITVVFLLLSLTVPAVFAQESTTSDKEKELKLQQAISQQKKALAEQQKALDQQHRDLYKIVSDSAMDLGRGGEGLNFYRSRVRNSGNSFEGWDQPMVVSTPRGEPFSVFYGPGGDAERTTWDYSKQVKESTYSRDLSFDVEKTATQVSMSVMGDCKSGQIRVKITMPGGKVYSDVVIDESGNLNWRKSFKISEDQNKDKAGEWKFRIEAEKATGYFKISLQTY